MGSNILDSYCSDHNPMSLNMVIGEKVRGKGYWKFPEFLLSDQMFAEHVQDTISQCVHDNAGANPGLLWDTIKTSIQGSTIDYLSLAKHKRKFHIEKVEADIHTATCNRDLVACSDPTACTMYVKHIQDLQKELDVIYENLNAPFKTKKAATAYFESNRCTKYYFKQWGKNNHSLKSLIDSNGILITDNNKILQCCKDYYDSLYRQPYLFSDIKARSLYVKRNHSGTFMLPQL